MKKSRWKELVCTLLLCQYPINLNFLYPTIREKHAPPDYKRETERNRDNLLNYFRNSSNNVSCETYSFIIVSILWILKTFLCTYNTYIALYIYKKNFFIAYVYKRVFKVSIFMHIFQFFAIFLSLLSKESQFYFNLFFFHLYK